MVVYSGFLFALVRRVFVSWSVPSCSDLSSFFSRLMKLGLIADATIWFSANLATLVGLFVVIRFFRISFIFRKCSRTFIRALLCVPLLYCATELRSYMRLSPFFSLFRFVHCASVLQTYSYFWGIVLFGSCEHSASTVFCSEFSFSFVLRLPI